MKYLIHILILVLLTCSALQISAQTDMPDEPEFISASIIPESNPLSVKLTWNPSDSVDVAGYIIYQIINSITVTIDTVNGRMSTSYIYLYPQANYNPERFRLAAFNSRLLLSRITDSHTTMKLEYEYEKCDVEVKLKWTGYIGWEDGVSLYRIYRRSEGNGYTHVADVGASELEYVDNTVLRNVQYYYYVEAVNSQGYAATTNSVSMFTDSHRIPSFLTADYATVENDYINLKFSVDNSAEVQNYLIQRKGVNDTVFTTIMSIFNTGQQEIFFSDNNVDVDNNVYNYRIVSIDLCGYESGNSNISSNIVLSVSNVNNLEQFLSWTPYESWGGGVYEYNIYNTFDYNGFFVGSKDTATLEYFHNIESYVVNSHRDKRYISNRVCYYIEAVENSTVTNRSRSNISCAMKNPEIWMPTAFNPTSYDEENRTFRPIITFYEKDSFEFAVYDRWGEKVYRTNDVYEGWDGRLNDKLAPSYQYQYLVKYKDYNGKVYEKTGIFFMLVR